MKRIVGFLLCLLLALLSAVGTAETAARVEALAEGVLSFQAAQTGEKDVAAWRKNKLPQTMGVGGEWYAMALHRRGEDVSACREGLVNYLSTHKVRSATTRQKLALTLCALDGEDPFITATLADSIGKQGVMSWAWGLHLLNNGCESPMATKEECIKTLLSLRKADGGWAITGNVSDADATAMVLQALAPHREDEEVAAAIDGALTLLSSRQMEDGGFASYGIANTESVAQVIIALCALNTDPFADERFIKNGITLLDALESFCLADGSFSHETAGAYSESATAQAFLALTAYQRFRAGGGSIYLLDDGAQPGQIIAEPGYQLIAVMIIGGAALIGCVVLLVMGKRHPKNFLALAIAAAALMTFVLMTDFQTADDYYSVAVKKNADVIGQVTLSIRCDKVAGRAQHIPADGVILAEMIFPIAQGDTVYTILTDAARAHGIHMESSGAEGLMYIHGIGNLYEFDFGDLSGWIYLVNGQSASVGCDQHILKDGDRLEWQYTLELGKDIAP